MARLGTRSTRTRKRYMARPRSHARTQAPLKGRTRTGRYQGIDTTQRPRQREPRIQPTTKKSERPDDSTSAATSAQWQVHAKGERRARGPTGGAQLLDRRPRRIADGGHGPGARGAHPTGLVAPLEEVCLQPEAGSAICVQRFDDSLNSAIRTTYRISLRSSSLLMPRYPSTRVVYLMGSTRPAHARAQSHARAQDARGGGDKTAKD